MVEAMPHPGEAIARGSIPTDRVVSQWNLSQLVNPTKPTKQNNRETEHLQGEAVRHLPRELRGLPGRHQLYGESYY